MQHAWRMDEHNAHARFGNRAQDERMLKWLLININLRMCTYTRSTLGRSASVRIAVWLCMSRVRMRTRRVCPRVAYKLAII